MFLRGCGGSSCVVELVGMVKYACTYRVKSVQYIHVRAVRVKSLYTYLTKYVYSYLMKCVYTYWVSAVLRWCRYCGIHVYMSPCIPSSCVVDLVQVWWHVFVYVTVCMYRVREYLTWCRYGDMYMYMSQYICNESPSSTWLDSLSWRRYNPMDVSAIILVQGVGLRVHVCN